jgi:hypothetical protein
MSSLPDHEVVGKAIQPPLAGFERSDYRMVFVAGVRSRVSILGIVAAADVAAGHAESQMNPTVSNGEAFLAAVRGARFNVLDVAQMLASQIEIMMTLGPRAVDSSRPVRPAQPRMRP